ncbi:zona pellucida sperm-binding protein 2 [Amia ocellicauda]|uniref:zona pellucida sperm-binding protein 2 n=1 Tax=Amia ocellicauda TaxID=2972642 RepID=UPI003464E3B9
MPVFLWLAVAGLSNARQVRQSVIMETTGTSCSVDYMEAFIPEAFPDFDATGSAPAKWAIQLNDGKDTLVMTISEAEQAGFEFPFVQGKAVIRAYYTAKGLQIFGDANTQSLYMADLTFALINSLGDEDLEIDVLMICVPAPVVCTTNAVDIGIPAFPGTFLRMDLGTETYLPFQNYSDVAISVTAKGLLISVNAMGPQIEERNCVDQLGTPGQQMFLPECMLTFAIKGKEYSMVYEPSCPCDVGLFPNDLCEGDHMKVEVSLNVTIPPLERSSVQLRDPTCKASDTVGSLLYIIPLNGCGTTSKIVNGQLIYENEVFAVKTIVQGMITRDSEFRLTVRCTFNHSSSAETLQLAMRTKAPPPPVLEQGELMVVLRAYPDVQYSNPYGIQDYPVVKYLREPVYLEAQVLNRLDPDIKLALDDCWATGSSSPDSLPRWDIIVNGCEYEDDNDKTVQHPMSAFQNLQFPSYYRRFELKMFTFVSGGRPLTDLVYFHCSTLICDSRKPDSDLCSKTCPSGFQLRRRRGVGGVQPSSPVDEVVASLPGPIVITRHS